MRVGSKLANFGPQALDLLAAAESLEDAGVDSVWLSDRLVTVVPLHSAYPFTPDGSAPWAADTPFLEAVAAMAMVAGRTHRVEIGTGVLVLPLRHPVLLARQLAAVDRISGGRVLLGVGSGWMAEEFALLGVPFDERGERTDEGIAVLRACWESAATPIEGHHHRVPDGVSCNPTPARRIPVLAGGMTGPALRRAGRADGWFGYMTTEQLLAEPDLVPAAMDLVRVAAATSAGIPGRGTATRRDTLRVVGPPEQTARVVPALVRAGITEIVIDVDWRHPERVAADVTYLRDAAAEAEPHPAAATKGDPS